MLPLNITLANKAQQHEGRGDWTVRDVLTMGPLKEVDSYLPMVHRAAEHI